MKKHRTSMFHIDAYIRLLLGIALLMTASVAACSGKDNFRAQWVGTVLSADGASTFRAVAVDGAGNIYTAGTIKGTGVHDFGNGVACRGIRQFNAVLTKYDPTGLAVWARTITSGQGNSGYAAIALDDSSNLYVCGFIQSGKFSFASGVDAQASALGSGVLVKYDSSGKALWVNALPRERGRSSFKSISIDPAGNVYAVGDFSGWGDLDLGNGVTAAGPLVRRDGAVSTGLIVKFDARGTLTWARSLPGSTAISGLTSVSASAQGDIFVSGFTEGPGQYDLGEGVLSTGGTGTNFIVAKYDSSGKARWVGTISSEGGGNGYLTIAAQVDGSGVYAAGYLTNAVTYRFGPDAEIKGAPPSCYFLANYDLDGVLRWARSQPGDPDSGFLCLAVGALDQVVAGGWITGSMQHDFGDGVKIEGGQSGRKAAIVLSDPLGKTAWAQSPSSGTTTSKYFAVAVDGDGNFVAVGEVGKAGVLSFGDSLSAKSISKENSAIVIKWKTASH